MHSTRLTHHLLWDKTHILYEIYKFLLTIAFPFMKPRRLGIGQRRFEETCCICVLPSRLVSQKHC